MRLLLVAAVALCTSSLGANADTLYTNASQFASATTTSGTVTFGNFLPGNTTIEVAPPAFSLSTAGGYVSFTPMGVSIMYLNSPNYQNYSYSGGDYASVLSNTGSSLVTVSFPSAVTAFSLELGGLLDPLNSAVLILPDSSVFNLSPPGTIASQDPLTFFGVVTTTPIHHFILDASTLSGQTLVFDNVSFGDAVATTPPVTTATAPEPGSLMLLGTGLLGGVGLLKRRFV